jgi:hypothetical protein
MQSQVQKPLHDYSNFSHLLSKSAPTLHDSEKKQKSTQRLSITRTQSKVSVSTGLQSVSELLTVLSVSVWHATATSQRTTRTVVATSQSWTKTDMSSNPSEHTLEPKFGWGCKDNHLDKEVIAQTIEQLEVDPSWRPNEVIRYISKIIRSS